MPWRAGADVPVGLPRCAGAVGVGGGVLSGPPDTPSGRPDTLSGLPDTSGNPRALDR